MDVGVEGRWGQGLGEEREGNCGQNLTTTTTKSL